MGLIIIYDNRQEAEREVTKSIVGAHIAAGLSQKKLADRCGMKAANLCRLENGNGNPSVATLAQIAHGLGKKLQISFARRTDAQKCNWGRGRS